MDLIEYFLIYFFSYPLKGSLNFKVINNLNFDFLNCKFRDPGLRFLAKFWTLYNHYVASIQKCFTNYIAVCRPPILNSTIRPGCAIQLQLAVTAAHLPRCSATPPASTCVSGAPTSACHSLRSLRVRARPAAGSYAAPGPETCASSDTGAAGSGPLRRA